MSGKISIDRSLLIEIRRAFLYAIYEEKSSLGGAEGRRVLSEIERALASESEHNDEMAINNERHSSATSPEMALD